MVFRFLILLAGVALSSCSGDSRYNAAASEPNDLRLEEVEREPSLAPDTSNSEISQRVILQTLTPDVKIMAVEAPYNTIDVEGLGTDTASFTLVADDHGLECNLRDMWVKTSDQTVISINNDICDNGLVKLDTAWAPNIAEAQEAHVTAEWIGSETESAGADSFMAYDLIFGSPQSPTLIKMSCYEGSGWISLSFPFAERTWGEGLAELPASIIASDDQYKFKTDWEFSFDDTNQVIPTYRIPTQYPLFTSLLNASDVVLNVGSDPFFKLPVSSLRRELQPLLKGCEVTQ